MFPVLGANGSLKSDPRNRFGRSRPGFWSTTRRATGSTSREGFLRGGAGESRVFFSENDSPAGCFSVFFRGEDLVSRQLRVGVGTQP